MRKIPLSLGMAASGEINCLDPGGFGALTITKSISIVCDYIEGGVLSAVTTGFPRPRPTLSRWIESEGCHGAI
jgi:hypothetical protein